MLPQCDERRPLPPRNPPLLARKNSFSSVGSVLKSYVSVSHPRIWLLFTILLIQMLLLFFARSITVPLSHRRIPPPSAAVNSINATGIAAVNSSVAGDSSDISTTAADTKTDIGDQCSLGKIYVYDLPKEFNTELLANCHTLSPWGSRCNALSNQGFGLKAAEKLAGVVPDQLLPTWYWTDQFTTEVIFHNRILRHRCRTSDPASAKAFYIPFYVGLVVDHFLWSNYTAAERDNHCRMMLNWVTDQPYFKQSYGWDHFLTMGRITWDFRRSKDEDWGSGCIYMPEMRNITRLLIERNPWDYFDVGVPYPTGFHPGSAADVVQWQEFVRGRERTTLFSFAGGTRGQIRNDFRGLLLNHCRTESDVCQLVECNASKCSNGSSAILETFLDSEFCLQPRGDSFTRRSIFDCMVAGSIPVFFWHRTAYMQYQWFLPPERESYSVFIHRNDVKNGTSIRNVLEKYSKEEKRKMREKVIEYIPKFVYAFPQEGLGDVKDAFDVAIDGVLRRFEEQEQPGFKW